MIKVSTCIHDSSLNIATDPEQKKSLQDLDTTLWKLQNDKQISKELYRDILELLKPLGDISL
jgi:hypothetical protein